MTDNTPTYAQIAQMLKDRAADFAPHILGEQPTMRTPSQLRFYPKGGFVVFLTGKKAGKFTDFADDKSGDMVDLIQRERNLSRHDSIEYAKNWLGIESHHEYNPPNEDEINKARQKAKEDEAKDQKRRLSAAQWLWKSSKDDHGEVVRYFNNRGITIPLTDCVKARKIDEQGMEKMGLIEDGVTGEVWSAVFGATDLDGNIRAVQQILIHNGKKINHSFPDVKNAKRTNGLMEGAAVKLGTVKDVVAFAEGPETGFSFFQATNIPTWILLGSKNFVRVNLPASVKKILICADIEEGGNGIAAALRTAAHWQALDYEVEIIMPDLDDGDFNDVLCKKNEESIRLSVKNALTSPLGQAKDTTVLCEDPRDGLLIWQATGYTVLPTVRPLRTNYHGPDEAPQKLVVLTTRGEPIDEEALVKRYPETEIRGLSVRSATLRSAVDNTGGMADLVRFATPAGKIALFGLSRLIGRHDNPILLCTNTADAARAQKVSSHAVIAWTSEPDKCDFKPLTGRDIIIAAPHSPEGSRQAADAAAQAREAGAIGVKILEWPLFAPQGTSNAILFRQVPKNYDLGQALKDGWEGPAFDNLLELAVAV